MPAKDSFPIHLQVLSDGHLYDMRKPDKYSASPVRRFYRWHYGAINNLHKVKATLRAGPKAWPGGYPLYLVTQDGGALCFDCARKEFRQIVWDYLNGCSTGWRVRMCAINHEDNDLICDHCNKPIEPAYGKD